MTQTANKTAAPSAALRLTIDGPALASNWRALDQLSGSATAAAAVKADAYGVGARLAVPVLRAAGCRDFFVAHWAEAQELLDLVPPASLSVLHGPLSDQDAAFARATGVRPVINTPAQARLWLAGGGGPCDVMVDTGMNRLGLAPADLDDPAVAALDVELLMSHLASADEDSAQNGAQLACWRTIVARVPHRRASLANSAGIALGAAYHADLTRPGLALYGGVPRGELAGVIRQVMQLEAAIIQTRDLQAGDKVGYNGTFVAPAAMRVAVVSLGYADGYLRCWSDKGIMLHGGLALPVVGRVSMDMTVVDISAAAMLREGDWLDVQYDLPQAAQISGLSQYELLTLMGRRFGRSV